MWSQGVQSNLVQDLLQRGLLLARLGKPVSLIKSLEGLQGAPHSQKEISSEQPDSISFAPHGPSSFPSSHGRGGYTVALGGTT